MFRRAEALALLLLRRHAGRTRQPLQNTQQSRHQQWGPSPSGWGRSTGWVLRCKHPGRPVSDQLICFIGIGIAACRAVTSKCQLFCRDGYQHFRGSQGSFFAGGSATDRTRKIVLITSGAAAVIYSANRQEIPYTHRKHFCLCPVSMERLMGVATFDQAR
jgi:hypothetical protein